MNEITLKVEPESEQSAIRNDDTECMGCCNSKEDEKEETNIDTAQVGHNSPADICWSCGNCKCTKNYDLICIGCCDQVEDTATDQVAAMSNGNGMDIKPGDQPEQPNQDTNEDEKEEVSTDAEDSGDNKCNEDCDCSRCLSCVGCLICPCCWIYRGYRACLKCIGCHDGDNQVSDTEIDTDHEIQDKSNNDEIDLKPDTAPSS